MPQPHSRTSTPTAPLGAIPLPPWANEPLLRSLCNSPSRLLPQFALQVRCEGGSFRSVSMRHDGSIVRLSTGHIHTLPSVSTSYRALHIGNAHEVFIEGGLGMKGCQKGRSSRREKGGGASPEGPHHKACPRMPSASFEWPRLPHSGLKKRTEDLPDIH